MSIDSNELQNFIFQNSNILLIYYFSNDGNLITHDTPKGDIIIKSINKCVQRNRDVVEFTLVGLCGLRTYIGEKTYGGSFAKKAFEAKFDEYGITFKVNNKIDAIANPNINFDKYINQIRYRDVYYTGGSVEGLTFVLTTKTENPQTKKMIMTEELRRRKQELERELLEIERQQVIMAINEKYEETKNKL